LYIQRLHVDFEMLYCLSGVQQDGDAPAMSRLYDLPDGIDPAQRVGNIIEGDDLYTFQQPVEPIDDQYPVLVYRDHAQVGILLLAGHLPGDDIGMMLHGRHQNIVAGLQYLFRETGRHEIDTFGGTARKNDLVVMTRIDKIRYLLSCPLIRFSGLLAEIV